MTTTPSKRDDVKGPERIKLDALEVAQAACHGHGDTAIEWVRADLYDQLKAERDALNKENNHIAQLLVDRTKERDRYRKALERIQQPHPGSSGIAYLQSIAREALHPPTNPIAPGSEVDGGGG